MTSSNKNAILARVREDRREFVARLLATAAFAAPTALALSTVVARDAHAEGSSQSQSGAQSASSGGGSQSSSGGGSQSSGGGGSQSSGGGFSGIPGPQSSGSQSSGFDPMIVPEPTTVSLLGLGLASAEMARRGAAKRQDESD
ncbi:MAG: PEP-CTERM sorting domain-containing protein [Pseudomonadota bacterium]